MDAGVESELARVVCEAHAELLSGLVVSDPIWHRIACTQLAEVCRDHPGAIKARPECAGLLQMCRDPARMATVIENGSADDVGLWLGMFARLAAREDVRRLEQLFPDEADLLATLTRRGFVGGEALFFPQANSVSDEAARAYRIWLAAELRRAISEGGDRLSSVVVFASVEGPTLLSALNRREFRDDFRRRWQLLGQLLFGSQEDLIVAAGRVGLWDFLALPDAAGLWAKAGSAAIELFAGDRAYPSELRSKVAGLLAGPGSPTTGFVTLARGEAAALQPLRDFDLTPSQWEAFAKSALAASDDPNKFRDRLIYLTGVYRNSKAGFLEEIQAEGAGWSQYLPGYDLYKFIDKRLDGRETSNSDLFFAMADVLTAPIPGGKAGTTLGKSGAKAGSKEAAERAVREAGRQVLEQSAKEGVQQVAKRSAREWGFESLKLVLKELCDKAVKRHAIAKVSLDVTPIVRFMFERSGLGRESFRKLTGLEARLFMRRDAKLFIHLRLDRLGVQVAVSRFLQHPVSGPVAAALAKISNARSDEDALAVLEELPAQIAEALILRRLATLLLHTAIGRPVPTNRSQARDLRGEAQ